MMLAAVAAFFAAAFGAGYALGLVRGARWLDDPPARPVTTHPVHQLRPLRDSDTRGDVA